MWDAEQYRLACDMFTLFFLFDEYTDVADGKKAQELADLALKPLRNLNAECRENAHALEKVALGYVVNRNVTMTA